MSGENYDYDGSFRLGEGEIDLGHFDETYAIELFPRQDDQPNIVDWLPEPLEGSDVYSDFDELIEDMAGGADTWGNDSFTWFMGYWSPLMVKYFINRFFPDKRGSRRVTVMTFDRGYGFKVVHATMWRPILTDSDPAGTGYNRVKIPFVNAVMVEA